MSSLARPDTTAEWVKYPRNPVLGGDLGTCFDVSVDHSGDRYRMWFSWRPKRAIGYAESHDGLHWIAHHEVVLGPVTGRADESLYISRPFVLVEDDLMTMWYTAHSEDRVVIARATGVDGLTWHRHGTVLVPEMAWEKSSLMCPSVVRDDGGTYHMWYSGGERYEPDAIGYASSRDGISWHRVSGDPVLVPGAAGSWESDRVAGAHIFRLGDYLFAAYIGFATGFEDSAIGIARSTDGVHWERHAENPVITRGASGEFDSINVYKPFVIVEGESWKMWFNGSSPKHGDDNSHANRLEQIGFASSRFQFRPQSALMSR